MKTDKLIEKYRELCFLLDEHLMDDFSPDNWNKRKDLYNEITVLEAEEEEMPKARDKSNCIWYSTNKCSNTNIPCWTCMGIKCGVSEFDTESRIEAKEEMPVMPETIKLKINKIINRHYSDDNYNTLTAVNDLFELLQHSPVSVESKVTDKDKYIDGEPISDAGYFSDN